MFKSFWPYYLVAALAALIYGGLLRAQTPSADTATEDCLAELNAQRAQRGLPPYVRDDGLTAAAASAARFRAARRLFGHTENDFQHLPAGCTGDLTSYAAGCAAYPREMGFLACAMYETEYTHAGAAAVAGADGKRYCHLFVKRGPSGFRLRGTAQVQVSAPPVKPAATPPQKMPQPKGGPAAPVKPAPAKPAVAPCPSASPTSAVTTVHVRTATGPHPRLTTAAGVVREAGHAVLWHVFHPLGGRLRCR